jgi:hypothetical protein
VHHSWRPTWGLSRGTPRWTWKGPHQSRQTGEEHLGGDRDRRALLWTLLPGETPHPAAHFPGFLWIRRACPGEPGVGGGTPEPSMVSRPAGREMGAAGALHPRAVCHDEGGVGTPEKHRGCAFTSVPLSSLLPWVRTSGRPHVLDSDGLPFSVGPGKSPSTLLCEASSRDCAAGKSPALCAVPFPIGPIRQRDSPTWNCAYARH